MSRIAAMAIAVGWLHLHAESGVAAETSPKGSNYLRLTFTQSVDDCKAEQKTWITTHSAKDISLQCFANATSGRRTLPAFLFQVASEKTALQPATGSMTFTYRALGPIQLAKDLQGANPTPPGNGDVKFYQMMVFSNPTTPEQKAVYNDWYDHEHIPEVLHYSGFISGQRFVQIDVNEHNDLSLPRYLVVFTLKSRDLKATNGEFGARMREGHTMSPAFDVDSGVSLFVTPLE